MKILFTILLFLNATYLIVAQQTISDWQHEKELSSDPRFFIKAGKKIYFLASSQAKGEELWVTEGSIETTHFVKQISSERNNASFPLTVAPIIYTPFNPESWRDPYFFKNAVALENGTLYFVNTEYPTEKPKIWITDGTEKGTQILREEVKGNLFHTGDELVEYVIDAKNGRFNIYHQDTTKNVSLTIGKADLSNSSKIKDNLIQISHFYYSAYSAKYEALIDLKEQKIKWENLSNPLANQYGIKWNNDIYNIEYAYKIPKITLSKLNTTTFKTDTLLVYKPKMNEDISPRIFPTTKEFFISIGDSLYSYKNGKITSKTNPKIYKTVLNNYRNLYDPVNDEMYAFEENDSKKEFYVRSAKMSDGTLIKDFNVPNVQFLASISPNKIWVKEYYSNPYKISILDLKTQKLKEFPYLVNSIIENDNKMIFSGYSTKSKVNSELYSLDIQTDEVKLLKDINPNGYLKSTIFTTTFDGKLVQVYNNEKGIMLAVSDGTKSGTKDVKLLIKNYDITALSEVIFKEANNRLGLLISTKNGNNYLKDSIYCFSTNKNFTEINHLIVSSGRTINILSSETFSTIDSLGKIMKITILHDNPSYQAEKYLSDLTPQNTRFVGNNVLFYEISVGNIIMNFNPENSSIFGDSYLLKYDLKTFSGTIVPNSQKCGNVKIFENKLYFYQPKNSTYYVTDGITSNPLNGIKNIKEFIKIKNKLYIIENPPVKYYYLDNQYITDYRYSLWQVENNTAKLILHFDSTSVNNANIITKLWEINGRSYLLLNLFPKKVTDNNKTFFYEIGNDFTLKKVFQIDEYIQYQPYSTIQFLKKGIIFKKQEGKKIIFFVMDENFEPKEIYRTNDNEKALYEPPFTYQSQKPIFTSFGNLILTDGSLEGSKLLMENNLESSYSISQKLNIEGTKFYFSLAPISVFGNNLWITDGTKEGTIQILQKKSLKDIPLYDGISYGNPSMGMIGNRYFFKMYNRDKEQFEVWITDGTIESTKLLKDFKGNIVSQTNKYTYYQDKNYDIIQWQSVPKINNKLYFSRQLLDTGFEPWQTDGTPEGTILLGDLVKGRQSSEPYQFVELNQKVYCIATETNKALQLWSFCNPKTTLTADNNLPINLEPVKLMATQNNAYKYQWLRNGNTVENADLSTLKVASMGTYQVRVEDEIGCTNLSDSLFINFTQKILANEPFTNSFGLKIYPNPTQNDLNITFESSQRDNFEATLYDITGKIMVQKSVGSNINNTLNMQDFSSGVYFLRLTDGVKQSVRKIVKD